MNYEPTKLQLAGLAAACAAFNTQKKFEHDGIEAAKPEEEDRVEYAPVSDEAYWQARNAEMFESYATQHLVGKVAPFEFGDRFRQRGVYDAIINSDDPNVQALVADLKAKTDPVNLESSKLRGAMAYLQAVKLISAEDAEFIINY
ncbi:MAG: hypothetical protein WA045_14315 [Nitrospira sp.]